MGYFGNDKQQRDSARYKVFNPQTTGYFVSRQALMEEINRLLDEGQDFCVQVRND